MSPWAQNNTFIGQNLKTTTISLILKDFVVHANTEAVVQTGMICEKVVQTGVICENVVQMGVICEKVV